MTLLALSCVALAVLALIAYRIDRSFIAPAVVFSIIWFVALGIVWLAGDFFSPISTKTLGIYVLGAICFAIGSFVRVRPMPKVAPPPQERLRKARTCCVRALILLIVLSPVFMRECIAP